jgi:uncharacterized membrane protein
MSKKSIIFFVGFVLFLALPFFYFSFLTTNHIASLSNTEMIYLIIIITGLCFAFFIDKLARNKFSDDTKWLIFITSAAVVWIYAIYLLILTWSRYEGFISESIDLFYFHQTIWQLSNFQIPYLWNLNQKLYPIWSQHFSPILIFLVPFYWIAKSEGMLMIIQAIAAITSAIPIYLIAKHFLKSRSIGLAIAFSYLSFGGLQYGFGYGFHEILFFPILFLWSYYFYLKKKTKLYILFIILSLFVKEEVAFIAIFWGIYLFFFKHDKLLGLITAGLGILWYFLCFNIIFPYFNNGNGFGYWGQYDTDGGSGFFGIIKSTIVKPFTFLQTLVTPNIKVDMIFDTFGQFAFLLFLFPPAIIIVFPSLMEKLLSSSIAMANGAHYSAAIAAVTVVATFEALPHIYKYKIVKNYIHNKNLFFAALIFYCGLFSTVFFGYDGYSLIPAVHSNSYEKGLTDTNYQTLTQVIENLPTNATVSAQYQIEPHLHQYYKNITNWPGMTGTEDFVIVDEELPLVLGGTPQEYQSDIEKLAKNKNYQLIVANSGVYVFRRKSYSLYQN